MKSGMHVDHLLHDYLDGGLRPEVRHEVEQHLQGCAACRGAYEQLVLLVDELRGLPRRIEPARDLWGGIQVRMNAPVDGSGAAGRRPVRARLPQRPAARRPQLHRAARWSLALAGAAAVLLGAVFFWLYGRQVGPAWDVVRLEGTPRIGRSYVAGAGKLRVGEWLETDEASRAQLDVGGIGHVDVEPGTRLQLRQARTTDHRIALAEGQIQARIWAPPRLFFVETPSALAVDLGCAYTLTVDAAGTSLLHVTSGYVELEHAGRASVVPAGAMCMARPGLGPGTVFDQKASAALRRALARFDFEQGGAEALTEVLAEARATDAVTLWQLLSRARKAEHARIYDRLVELVPPPAGVTREGVLLEDPVMIDAWRRYLGLDVSGWWGVPTKKRKAAGERAPSPAGSGLLPAGSYPFR